MDLNWDYANAWQVLANNEKDEHSEPIWSWDCGFKLDFDGSLLRISSRFYPPHKNIGDWWEGNVTIMFFEEEILKKEFKCDTLDGLKNQVETFVKEYANGVKNLLKQ